MREGEEDRIVSGRFFAGALHELQATPPPERQKGALERQITLDLYRGRPFDCAQDKRGRLPPTKTKISVGWGHPTGQMI